MYQPDYGAIAALYGDGATYDAVEKRFRKFRKIADELRAEAKNNGVTVPRGRTLTSGPLTPRTPRTRAPRNGVTKSGGSSGRSTSKFDAKLLGAPTKNGSATLCQAIFEAISVDTDSESTSVGRSIIKLEDETASEKDVVRKEDIDKIKEEPSTEEKADIKPSPSIITRHKRQPYVDNQANDDVDKPVIGPSWVINFNEDEDMYDDTA